MYNVLKYSIKFCIIYNRAAELKSFDISFAGVIKLKYLEEKWKCLNEREV